MQMKTLVAAVFTLMVGASLSQAADQPSGTQNNPGVTGTAPASDTSLGSPATQTPPSDWTNINGTVQSVDASAKKVQIQDTTGNVVEVSVDKQVSIQKNGKNISLAQVKTGDTITLAKRQSSNPGTPKAY
jgi:hypothetical protein